MPFVATILAALLGIGGVSLSNRATAIRAKTEKLLTREKEIENERTATRETILVLSNNVEHIVTELRLINQEWREDRHQNAEWQRHIEGRLGSIEGKVERYHPTHPITEAA